MFGLGLALSCLGLAIAAARPDWRSGAEGIALCIPVFGGLALIAISPVLQNALDAADARRRIAFGVRWIAAWLLLRWAFFAFGDLVFKRLDPYIGPAGSPSRMAGAFLLFVGGILLPLYFASPLAERIRRAAGWLAQDAPK